MIRLGLRLTLNGGKEAMGRLVMTTIAVALGVGMLLISLAALNALHAQNTRGAWLDTSPSSTGPTAAASSPLWWLVTLDDFHDQAIDRVDVAATGARSPVPPGIPRLPGPGQFYASPALDALLRSTPPAELGDRFPGAEIGTIGRSALPSPNALVAVVGYRVGQLSKLPGAEQVTAIQTAPGRVGPGGTSSTAIEVIIAVGSCALLFPLLIFVSTATRLAATRREQRFAAMRLVGATPRQVSVISAVESSIAACAAVVLGFCLFFALRPALAHTPLTGEPLFPGDLSLTASDILGVAIGVPLAAVGVARMALRRVQISPLGVTRHATPPPPRWYRVVPLFAGLGVLTWMAISPEQASTKDDIPLVTASFWLTMSGLILSGSWLTTIAARLAVRRARHVAPLIAGRRLADDPRGAFRAISGLILAVFVATVSTGVMATIVSQLGTASGGGGPAGVVVDAFAFSTGTTVPPISARTSNGLRSIGGVEAVTTIHTVPGLAGSVVINGKGPTGLVSCAELSRTPVLGRCSPGADVAVIVPDFFDNGQIRPETTEAAQDATIWPTSSVSLSRLARQPVQAVVVATNGSQATIERVRTALEIDYPALASPSTIGEIAPSTAEQLAEGQRLADVVILASLVIAGCSLTVGIAGSLSDRKRPFGLLRLTGVPLGVLRRVVALEGAVPLVCGAVVAVGAGIVSAELSLSIMLDRSLAPMRAQFYVIVAGGLVASLCLMSVVFPLLRRITGPEVARNE